MGGALFVGVPAAYLVSGRDGAVAIWMCVLMLGQVVQKLPPAHPHPDHHVNHFSLHHKLTPIAPALPALASFISPSIFKNIIIA